MSDARISPFEIASGRDGGFSAPIEGGDPSAPPLERVAHMVRSSDLFLFIKGTPQQPMCGFSANTVAVFDSLGVPYATFNVLSDDRVRSAAKEYASWPTFPQVYLRGEFLGGNDIITEMLASGELVRLVEGVK